MYLTLRTFDVVFIFLLTNHFLIINAVNYSDRHDYDAYGIRIASTDHFVVLAQNDGFRYVISMAPFGMDYTCAYNYMTSNDFIINIAVGRHQNSSQLSFVYLKTNSTDGQYLKLGLFTFSRGDNNGTTPSSCNRKLMKNESEYEVHVWQGESSEMSTLQVDPYGNFAYGFLSKFIFIYDIQNKSVKNFSWYEIFPSINIQPHALDITEINNSISIAIIAGYYQFDIEKTLPSVYLVRLNPPYNMTLVDNYTFVSDNQKFVRGRYTSTYQFNYVMSVSIHDLTQQVLIGVPQMSKTYLFSFNSTNLILKNIFDQSTRSAIWLDNIGIQVALLLSDVSTLPWAQSRIQVINTSSNDTLYAYPNNQQTLEQWSNEPPKFIRIAKTYHHQSVILTSEGMVILVPSTEAGYYMKTDDINNGRNIPEVCPFGTYKSISGPTPCTICPTMTKSSPINIVPLNSSNSTNILYPTINCTACLSSSFCPLASVRDLNESSIQSISQAYAYPISSISTSFDDILMENTFSLQAIPNRCLLVSPFFWALMTLCLAFIILLIMGLLYYLPTGTKHFHRLKCIFRHSDLIGNGELWFGGLISFSIIVLVIYCFWFGLVFVVKYPIETSSDSNFVCDSSLRNARLSSSLQLSATIKSDEEKPIFSMLDKQEFDMTIHFLQTGFTCKDISGQENIGTYSVTLPYSNCTMQPNDATLIVTYRVPDHQMTIQINLTGSYYIGGVLICLTGARSTNNDSSYVVQELNYCQLFYTINQTLGQTTEIYFALTKVINRTESLDYSDSMNYSGIWIPTSTHGSLNDRLAYLQRGAFQRYLSTQHTLIIKFSETQFYVINKQEPVARTGEVIFHNILFTTTIIGIFALAFLFFKLTFMPIIQYIIKREILLSHLRKLKKKKLLDIDNIF